jgi:mannose-6-phosphate isomerase
MNYLVLSPGEALFIPADGLHTYLSGDIVECMARSNDVLNTGFCPRVDRDSVEVFTEALTFHAMRVDEMMLDSKGSEKGRNGKTRVYAPPMSEFNLLVTELAEGEGETVERVRGPMVMIAMDGSGTMEADGKRFDVQMGYVFFIGCGKEVRYEAEGGLKVYTAYVE